MKMDAVVGARGFIGESLTATLREMGQIVIEVDRETNRAELRSTMIDTVFFCAGNSKSFLARERPLECLKENVCDLYDYLSALNYRKFVYISSSVVYPSLPTVWAEDCRIDISELSLYGAHKYLAEQYVRSVAPSWVIVRPTGFFGKGLKKNLLYDLRNNHRDVYLKAESWVDYMPIEWFCRTTVALAGRENEIVNIGSGCPIEVRELLEQRGLAYVFHEERLVDDRWISFEKLRGHIGELPDPKELKQKVLGFVRGSPDD